MNITIDRDACIGCGSCVEIAPEVFRLDDEEKAIVLDEQGAEEEIVIRAAESCPVEAIYVADDMGKQLLP
jgi:ferredoxin